MAGASLVACAAASAAAPLPKLASATVVGDRVTLTFTGALKPGFGAWTAVVNGRPATLGRASVSGRHVQVVLPRPAYGDDAVRVVGRFLRARSGARLRIVDTKPTVRSAAGCSEELGAVTRGQASEGPTDRETFLDAGRFDLLAVQVDYADAPAGGSSFSSPLQVEAVDHWIRSLSYGRSSVGGSVHPSVVRMAKNFVDYAHSGAWSSRKTFFQDLVLRLDGEVDFSRYDAVVVSTTRPRRTPGSLPTQLEPLVLAPVGSGIVADGKELRHFAAANSLTLLQTLLRLAGLPALDGGYATGWDLMAGPPEANRLGLLAWHRRKLGWLRPTEVRCLRTGSLELTLAPTWRPGGVKALVVPTGRNSAVVLENRQRQGPDAGLCTKGILAYEIRVDWRYQLWVLARDRSYDVACGHALSRATFDFERGGSTRVGGTTGGVAFEVLDVLADGSYRLRVSR